MNVLLHCVYFPPEVGGLESHVYYLARALVEHGHRVEVVTSRSLPGVPSMEEMEGIRVHRTWFPRRSPVGWVAHALASIPKTRALSREADVIHAQAFSSVLPAALGGVGSGRPVVATFHTSHFLSRAENDVWRPILGRLVALPDYSLAASQEIADVAMALAPGVQVEALTNGVETSVFRPVEPTLPETNLARIVVPRRLFKKNGVEFLVRALPSILKEAEVEALLIGDGPEREFLQALAHDLGVGDRISFLGKRAHREMPGLFSSCDLAVIPSLMEATSVAALEAMACELPVVASEVGGLPEIVSEGVGRLCEPGNPEALAEAVVSLLNSGRMREMGRAARSRVVERWSNDRLARRHMEIYSDLLQRRG